MVGDVDLDGDAPNDRFGFAVSLSGDGRRMAVATGTRAPGLVKVYERDGAGASWVRMGADITGLSNYGTTVSLSEDGSILAVGAEQNSLVRVYQWDGTNSGWIPMGSDITSIVAGSKDLTGGSVSLSSEGTRVAVGSHYYEQNYRGYVRVFEWDAGANSWNLMGSGLPGANVGDAFGHSVSLSGNGDRLAVGAFHNDDNGNESGQVKIYEWSVQGSTWV